jgi:hypothetical protein
MTVINAGETAKRRSLSSFIVLSIGVTLSLRCGSAPQSTGSPNGRDGLADDPGHSTPTQMHVTSFTVAEGEVKRVSANLEIIAAEGIDVSGDLIVDGSAAGDLALTAENGDIDLSGRIIVEQPDAASKPSDQSPATPKLIGVTNQLFSVERRGASIILTAVGPNRDINMKRFTLLQSGRGYDATDETVVLMMGNGLHVGADGTNGGDIILRAPQGTIRIPADRQPGDPALFGLGDGGDGADVTVDRLGFDTDQSSLELRAGNGGDSGQMIFEALSVAGVPTAGELETQPELIEGGTGGRGGHVVWDNTSVGVLSRDLTLPILEKKFPLQGISLHGGNGGGGAQTGGRGGRAAYWSGRAVNEVGQNVAATSVFGGNGGDVLSSPVPILHAQGGEGGEFIVVGNAGWKGTGEFRDGAAGGDVLGQGGAGGDVSADVQFVSATGGNGGNSKEAKDRVVKELGFVEDITTDHQVLLLSVSAGRGGGGFHRVGTTIHGECDGCPGGRGGDLGRETAYGGDGGTVHGGSGTGGRGGDVWSVGISEPGWGGEGNPPGQGGCVVERVIEPGLSGEGDRLGQAGTRIGHPPTYELGDCSPDGAPCGQELECNEDPQPPPDSEPPPDAELCSISGAGPTGSAPFRAEYVEKNVNVFQGTESIRENRWVENVSWVCNENSSCCWKYTQLHSWNIKETDRDGNVFTDEGEDSTSGCIDDPAGFLGGGLEATAANRPDCYQDRSVLVAPNSGRTTVPLGGDTVDGESSSRTYSFAGCTTVYFDDGACICENYECQQDGPQRIRRVGTCPSVSPTSPQPCDDPDDTNGTAP